MITQDYRLICESGLSWSAACIVIPLYNYEEHIEQTLASARRQTLKDLSLVIVDDCSKDGSARVAQHWLSSNAERFAKTALLRNVRNAGLSVTRNTGLKFAQSEFLFFLDADNLIYPECLEAHLEALRARPDAAGAYSIIEIFGATQGLGGAEVFSRARLGRGNYIDAMAMIRRERLLSLDGYHDLKFGWEDYDLWLRMCKSGDLMIHIPQILGRYRVHRSSMLRTQTNIRKNIEILRRTIADRHPWVNLA